MIKMDVRFVALVMASFVAMSAMANDACMVSPTEKKIVSGRFGKNRAGGAANFGSANQKRHMHDGLDFSTSGKSLPVYATTDGTVMVKRFSDTAGNMLLIKRKSGDIVGYMHLEGVADGVVQGATVKAGQYLGLSGNSPTKKDPAKNMVKHLHFTYAVPKVDDARAKEFSKNAAKGPFNPGQLASVVTGNKGVGWKTDPAPYFCETFKIQDGNPQDVAILGGDTKAQHAILFGDVPNGGVDTDAQHESVQVAAANSDAAFAAADGKSKEEWLSDTESYGSLPSPPLGDYDVMSASEMLFSESWRRFADAEWNSNITMVSSRALLADYNRAIGVGNFISEAITKKKARVEALLAIYTAQKLSGMKNTVDNAHERAQKDAVSSAIK